MTSITLSIDEKILERGRAYAQKKQTPFEQFVCQLIEREVEPLSPPRKTTRSSKDWWEHFLELAEQANGCSDGKWTRDELYERR